jgi:hypothetical protein
MNHASNPKSKVSSKKSSASIISKDSKKPNSKLNNIKKKFDYLSPYSQSKKLAETTHATQYNHQHHLRKHKSSSLSSRSLDGRPPRYPRRPSNTELSSTKSNGNRSRSSRPSSAPYSNHIMNRKKNAKVSPPPFK